MVGIYSCVRNTVCVYVIERINDDIYAGKLKNSFYRLLKVAESVQHSLCCSKLSNERHGVPVLCV